MIDGYAPNAGITFDLSHSVDELIQPFVGLHKNIDNFIYLKIYGFFPNQGCAFSSCPASLNNFASPP